MKSKWYGREIEIFLKWIRSESNVNSQWVPREIEVNSKWTLSEIGLVRKWSRSGIEVRSKWRRIEIKVESKLFESEFEMKSKWSLCDNWVMPSEIDVEASELEANSNWSSKWNAGEVALTRSIPGGNRNQRRLNSPHPLPPASYPTSVVFISSYYLSAPHTEAATVHFLRTRRCFICHSVKPVC